MTITLDGYDFPDGEQPYHGPLVPVDKQKWAEQAVLGNVGSILTMVGVRNQVIPMTCRASTTTQDKLQEIFDARNEVILKTNQNTTGFRVLMTKLAIDHKVPLAHSLQLCKFTLESREAASEASDAGPPPEEEDMPTVVVKSADETVNNSITIQDDNELLFAIGANETWIGFFMLKINMKAASDFKCKLEDPAGATHAMGFVSGQTDIGGHVNVGESSGGGIIDAHVSGDATVSLLLSFVVANGGTPGNVVLGWAQDAAVAEDTDVMALSALIAWKQT